MEEKMCNAIQNALNACCLEKPKVTCSNKKYHVECFHCKRSLDSVSPTEILVKWNNYFKDYKKGNEK